jgi:hypothetical protein
MYEDENIDNIYIPMSINLEGAILSSNACFL